MIDVKVSFNFVQESIERIGRVKILRWQSEQLDRSTHICMMPKNPEDFPITAPIPLLISDECRRLIKADLLLQSEILLTELAAVGIVE
jgi:hypothetical protein